MKKLLLGITLLPLLFQGCDWINPKEEIPAYVHVSSFQLKGDTIQQGTAVQKVSDVWVTTSTTNLGAYQLPITFPVVQKGPVEFLLHAGVLQNGISVTRIAYPFFDPYDTTINLQEKQIDTLRPVIHYSSRTKFQWLENFNGTSPTIKVSPRSETTFALTSNKDSAYEGASMEAVITSDKPFFECLSANSYDLPRGQPVWLELNYKTEVPVEVGVYAVGVSGATQKAVAGMNPIDHWNKIYIDLTEAVSEESTDKVFSIYIGALKGDSDAGGKLMIDNIKLLSF